MRISRPRKGVLGLAIAALLCVAAGAGVHSAWSLSAEAAAVDPALWIIRHARIRAYFEIGVILFQCAGVATLLLSRLVPTNTRWRSPGHKAFVGSLSGLGVSAVLCAWYASDFALFAGCALAILLSIVIFGDSRARPESVPHAMATRDGLTTV
jgi:hypothetical protein